MLQFKILKKIRSIIPHNILKEIAGFFKHYFGGLIKRIDEHNLFFSAAGISYSLFLGMIPFILLVFSLLGNIFDTQTLEAQIAQIIDTVIPYPTYADYMKHVIQSRLPEVIVYKTIAGFIGIIGLIFTSTWIFSSMRTILNQIFHTEIQKHALIGLLRDIGMVLLLVLFITFSTFILPALNIMMEAADNTTLFNSFNLTDLGDTIIRVISILFMLGMFFLLFYLIPYEKLKKRVALLSAFWTTLLWEVARNIFGYYIRYFFGSSAIYGAFVLIVVILLWVFYSSCIFIIGAEIGQLYRERRLQRKENLNIEAT
jgi:YihY family inner membrane protein